MSYEVEPSLEFNQGSEIASKLREAQIRVMGNIMKWFSLDGRFLYIAEPLDKNFRPANESGGNSLDFILDNECNYWRLTSSRRPDRGDTDMILEHYYVSPSNPVEITRHAIPVIVILRGHTNDTVDVNEIIQRQYDAITSPEEMYLDLEDHAALDNALFDLSARLRTNEVTI